MKKLTHPHHKKTNIRSKFSLLRTIARYFSVRILQEFGVLSIKIKPFVILRVYSAVMFSLRGRKVQFRNRHFVKHLVNHRAGPRCQSLLGRIWGPAFRTTAVSGFRQNNQFLTEY